MPKRSISLSKVYALIEPGPVVLLTTARKGVSNVMTMSWHTMIEFEPPLIGCVVSDRNYSFGLLKASRECVINIPTAEIVGQVVGCGNCTGAKVDKFSRFGLTPRPATLVQAPLIAECFASLECRVVDTRMVAKYSLFILQVLKASVDPLLRNGKTIHHLGYGSFMVAGKTIRLPSRMRERFCSNVRRLLGPCLDTVYP
jgi:flavin reductase (DIM6/NTAB) family NADH-FMN oxidoreductase RutF